jgi:hypothetical protein
MEPFHYLMSLLDDNKENIQESLYLQTCNLLKQLYIKNQDTDEVKFLYVKIEYVESTQNIILQNKGYLPFHNFVIKYKETEEYKIDAIDLLIYDLIFSTLKTETLKKIIEVNGGEEKAFKKMKDNVCDYEHFMCNSFNCSTPDIQARYLAYYIIDKIIVEYDHIIDNIPDNAIIIDDFIKICNEFY